MGKVWPLGDKGPLVVEDPFGVVCDLLSGPLGGHLGVLLDRVGATLGGSCNCVCGPFDGV